MPQKIRLNNGLTLFRMKVPIERKGDLDRMFYGMVIALTHEEAEHLFLEEANLQFPNHDLGLNKFVRCDIDPFISGDY